MFYSSTFYCHECFIVIFIELYIHMNDDPECKCLCERESNIYDIVSSKTKTRTFLVVVYGRFSVFFVVAFFGGWVLLLGGGGGGNF